MSDLVNISVGNAALTAVLGYAVVFFGIVLLCGVIALSGKILSSKKQPAAVSEPTARMAGRPAPGSAGELKLYDTDPRDAAMIMAIVADTLGKPLNELRFISIREVKEDEV